MQQTRRQVLAVAGGGLVAGLAGCTGELTGGGVSFGAEPATVRVVGQESTGYTEFRTREEVATETYEAFGVERTVSVTNHIAEYDREVGLGPHGRQRAAVFAVLSTPQVRVLGRAYNPVADLDAVGLVRRLQVHYDEFEEVATDGTISAEVAQETTDVARLTGRARLAEIDEDVAVYLYVSDAVALGDDFVITAAVHPRINGDRESTIRALLNGVQH